MNKTFINTKLILIAIGLAIALVFSSLFLMPEGIGSICAMILIILLGIPHGANDHILYKSLSSNKQQSYIISFLAKYLVLMGIFVGIWYYLPSLGLLAFLITSIYHFGEAEWHELSTKLIFTHLFYLVWGSFVLITPLLLNFGETAPILKSLLGYEVSIFAQWQWAIPLGLFVVSIVAITYAYIRNLINLKRWITELFSASILLFIFWWSNLLVGFAIYFVFWHSIPSIQDQVSFFKQSQPSYSLKKYLQEIIPFTLLAFAGIGLFTFGTSAKALSSDWIAHFFIMISIVTLPHSLLMHQLLKKYSSNSNSNRTHTKRENTILKPKKLPHSTDSTISLSEMLRLKLGIRESSS